MTKETFSPDQIGRGLGLFRLQKEADKSSVSIELKAKDQEALEKVQTHLQIMEEKGEEGEFLAKLDFAKCGVNYSCLEGDPSAIIGIFVIEIVESERERLLEHLNDCDACSGIFASTLRNYHRSYDDYSSR